MCWISPSDGYRRQIEPQFAPVCAQTRLAPVQTPSPVLTTHPCITTRAQERTAVTRCEVDTQVETDSPHATRLGGCFPTPITSCSHTLACKPKSAVLWRWGVLVVLSLHHHSRVKTSSRSSVAACAKLPCVAKPGLPQSLPCLVTRWEVQYLCPQQLAPSKHPRYRYIATLSLQVLGCVKNRCQLGWLGVHFLGREGQFQPHHLGAQPERACLVPPKRSKLAARPCHHERSTAY